MHLLVLRIFLKLKNKKSSKLTPEERSAVKLLLNSNSKVCSNENEEEAVNLSFAERVMKNRKAYSTQSTYVDTRFFFPLLT